MCFPLFKVQHERGIYPGLSPIGRSARCPPASIGNPRLLRLQDSRFKSRKAVPQRQSPSETKMFRHSETVSCGIELHRVIAWQIQSSHSAREAATGGNRGYISTPNKISQHKTWRANKRPRRCSFKHITRYSSYARAIDTRRTCTMCHYGGDKEKAEKIRSRQLRGQKKRNVGPSSCDRRHLPQRLSSRNPRPQVIENEKKQVHMAGHFPNKMGIAEKARRGGKKRKQDDPKKQTKTSDTAVCARGDSLNACAWQTKPYASHQTSSSIRRVTNSIFRGG